MSHPSAVMASQYAHSQPQVPPNFNLAQNGPETTKFGQEMRICGGGEEAREKRERMIAVLVFVVVVSACATMSDGSREFRTHQLPLARIKKIMKSDEDVKMIAAEAPVLFAKACEMFILELTLCSWIHTEENKWRTLQRNDIAGAITRGEIFDFLVDIVPGDELKDEDLAIPWTGVSGEAVPYGNIAKCCYQLGLCFTEGTFPNWQEMMVVQPAVVQTPQMMYQPPQQGQMQ
ncbi:unnamed protein product [Sphagnum balticum]